LLINSTFFIQFTILLFCIRWESKISFNYIVKGNTKLSFKYYKLTIKSIIFLIETIATWIDNKMFFDTQDFYFWCECRIYKIIDDMNIITILERREKLRRKLFFLLQEGYVFFLSKEDTFLFKHFVLFLANILQHFSYYSKTYPNRWKYKNSCHYLKYHWHAFYYTLTMYFHATLKEMRYHYLCSCHYLTTYFRIYLTLPTFLHLVKMLIYNLMSHEVIHR